MALRTGTETAWDEQSGIKVKVIYYLCGTILELRKIGSNFKGSTFTNNCRPELSQHKTI